MPSLIKLDKHEDSNEVHVGSVKLEGDCSWTDVIAAGHDSLHYQGAAHRVIETCLLWNTMQVRIKLLSSTRESFVVLLPEVDKAVEEQAKHNVAKVAEEMVEISHFP